MLLGHIQGKVTTHDFSFVAKEEPKNHEYVQVYHKVYGFVLCQILDVTKTTEKTQAYCQVIGYNDQGRVKRPRIPFEPESEVLRAEDDIIKDIIKLDKEKGAVLGHLEGRDIPVSLDLNKALTKHVAVLAKSGAGKSYTVGVLLEEILERGVPLVIIDPHGEYSGLSSQNTQSEEVEKLALYGLETKKYDAIEYADDSIIPNTIPLRIPNELSAAELSHLFPGKLSANQQAVLYSALKNMKKVTFDSLLNELELEESPAKYNLISTIEHLRSLPFFSAAPTPYHELVKAGRASIINLKGIAPDVQEIIVYKLAKDLFQLRKKNRISPFFLVVEEAHNFCPERSFGEAKSSKILRDIASEGRKFGLGLCVVSQRPARVDKSVLSQCSTQIILKVSNPNDLKALAQSVEGLTAEAEKEIKYLPIGSALLTGVFDVPLFVNIRPRRTQHGGRAVDILGSAEAAVSAEGEGVADMLEQTKAFEDQQLLPLIKPTHSAQDIEIMSEEPLAAVETHLVPAYQFTCKDGETRFKLLVEQENGRVVVDKDQFITKKLPALDTLSPSEVKILQHAFSKGTLSEEELIASAGGSLQALDTLKEQAYLIEKDQGLAISEEYLFTRLHKHANYDTISFEEIAYTSMRPDLLTVDELQENLSKFTIVEDHHQCYIVKYHPVRRKES